MVWSGARATHLAKLDRVQTRALRFCGSAVTIDSLQHRRLVGASAYLFKLLFMNPPEILTRLIPKPSEIGSQVKTRRAFALQNKHPYQLAQHGKVASLDMFKNAFPNNFVKHWDTIDASAFAGPFNKNHLENFMKSVNVSFHCLLYTSPSPRDGLLSRMPSSA